MERTCTEGDIISVCLYHQANATPGNSRLVYDHLVDYLYEAECHSGGMFESYGVILDFVAIENKVAKVFEKSILITIVEVLRDNVFTSIALVLASYLEARIAKIS